MSAPEVRLGVLGWPVRHSRSPAMHNAALARLGLAPRWRYQLLPVPPERFTETVLALPQAGFLGANVTIPHKEAALALATEATPTAARIGAANTLTFDPASGGVHAENTDAPGFLQALGRDPGGARALVLGAGGSARAIVDALVQGGAADVAVWNRTPERARALTGALGGRTVDAPEAGRFAFDVLVNCTSVGLGTPDLGLKGLPVSADAFGAGTLVVDMVYRPDQTSLVRSARERGASVVDGLEVLVAQGAASLERWTGRPAPRDVMEAAARRR